MKEATVEGRTYTNLTTCPYCGEEVADLEEAEYESWWDPDPAKPLHEIIQYLHWGCLTQAATEEAERWS